MFTYKYFLLVFSLYDIYYIWNVNDFCPGFVQVILLSMYFLLIVLKTSSHLVDFKGKKKEK